MVRHGFIWLLPAGMIFAGLLASCGTPRAFTEWVARQPEAVRFGCPSEVTNSSPAKLPVPMVLSHARAGPGLSRFAGNMDQHPTSLHVPFSEATPPLVVLQADLARILKAHGYAAENESATSPLQLGVTLQVAYADRIFHWLKSGELRGRVVFDLTIVDPKIGRTNWTQRLSSEHRIRPGYITSRSVEKALNGAYCEALAAFRKALASEELQASLRR